MMRLLFILLISCFLCTAPFWPQFEFFVDSSLQENTHPHDHAPSDSEVAYHEHDVSDFSGVSDVSDKEHTHRHSHGPGQPEHEHPHKHSQAPGPIDFSLLVTNLSIQIFYKPKANFHRFGLICVSPPTESFLRAVFRPPITLS